MEGVRLIDDPGGSGKLVPGCIYSRDCPRRQELRGLCKSHYGYLGRTVREGRTTWEKLVAAGRALAVKAVPGKGAVYEGLVKGLKERPLTGVDLLDWLYANMGNTKERLTSKPLGPGDLELLEEMQENRKEFYFKHFLPALPGRKAQAKEAADDPPEEPMDTATRLLQLEAADRQAE